MQFSNEIPWTKYLASTCNTPIHCKYYYYLLLLFLLLFLIRKRFSLSHIYRNRLFRPSRRTISFVSFHNSLIVVMFLFSFSLIAQHCLRVCLKWLLALGLNTLTSKNAFWLLIQNRFARVSKRTLSYNFAVAFNCCSSPRNLIKGRSTSTFLQTSNKNVGEMSLTSFVSNGYKATFCSIFHVVH